MPSYRSLLQDLADICSNLQIARTSLVLPISISSKQSLFFVPHCRATDKPTPEAPKTGGGQRHANRMYEGLGGR